jgi:hypothetical protein
MPRPTAAHEMEGESREPESEVIYFYGTREEFGFLSNFSAHPMVIAGRTWPTCEHYFQAQKFAGTEHEGAILHARSPALALPKEARPPASLAGTGAIIRHVRLLVGAGVAGRGSAERRFRLQARWHGDSRVGAEESESRLHRAVRQGRRVAKVDRSTKIGRIPWIEPQRRPRGGTGSCRHCYIPTWTSRIPEGGLVAEIDGGAEVRHIPGIKARRRSCSGRGQTHSGIW